MHLVTFTHMGLLVAFAEGPAEQEINRILGIIADFSPAVGVLVGIVVIAIFLYFFSGVTNYIRKDKADIEGMKKQIGWGILGIFVLVSIWGIVYLLQTTLLGTMNPEKPDLEFRRVESI